MKRVIALRALRYGGKSYKKGQELSVMGRHIDILKRIGRVEDAPPQVDRGVWGDVPAASPLTTTPLPSSEQVKQKRKYTRRVKVAEPADDKPAEAPYYYGRRDLTEGDY